MIFNYVKTKCEEGHEVFINKSDDDYYLSVPICVGALLDDTDPFIYIEPCITSQPFYFYNLYIPYTIECITFSIEKQQFISTTEREGCLVDYIDCDDSLYEIIHPDIFRKSDEEKSKFMKEFLQFFYTFGHLKRRFFSIKN